MRVLQISSEYPPQAIFGLGRYLAGLSRALAARGHDVHVLTNSMGGRGQETEDGGVKVHRVDYPPPPKPPSQAAPVMAFNLHLQQRAYHLGREALGSPEIIVSHDWLTALAGYRLARRWSIPHVWTVHDTVHGKRFGRIAEVEDKVAFAIESWATRSANLVLVNSRAIGDEIVSVYGGVRERIRLLHPGIEPDRSDADISEDRAQAFRSVFAAPSELLITYCGRLDLEKGIDTLINAVAVLRKTHPHARLAIVGRGVLEPTIRNHISRLDLHGAITLYGYLEGKVLDQFYRSSDIHVCPSHYEPFGMVATEAMASGIPTVVSRTGGLVDIVTSPDVGRTFPPGDASALAEVLFELANDKGLRRRLSLKGRAHVRKHFSWEGLSRIAEDHFSSVLAKWEAVPV